jgi:hypothetical protein
MIPDTCALIFQASAALVEIVALTPRKIRFTVT